AARVGRPRDAEGPVLPVREARAVDRRDHVGRVLEPEVRLAGPARRGVPDDGAREPPRGARGRARVAPAQHARLGVRRELQAEPRDARWHATVPRRPVLRSRADQPEHLRREQPRALRQVSVDLCVLVSHSHWDREWYRTFQAFRARLVDLLDRVLDLCASDPRFRFVLDGQTIVVEDYLAIRPGRRADLEAACRSGRIAIGPWYVQPDSLLPSGEAHVRNLLEGRATGAAIGGLSRVAYCPDSFGHPAQFPQLF